MKNLKFITLGIGLLVASVSFGQRVPQNNNNGKGSSESVSSQTPMYAFDTKKLASYFISGQIPADFPKYDATLTKEENKEIAKNWAKQHQDLITEEAKAKLNQ